MGRRCLTYPRAVPWLAIMSSPSVHSPNLSFLSSVLMTLTYRRSASCCDGGMLSAETNNNCLLFLDILSSIFVDILASCFQLLIESRDY